VASAERAKERLGWKPSRADLRGILRDAWEFTQNLENEK
jgi:UDP-glucose 4-epimerase